MKSPVLKTLCVAGIGAVVGFGVLVLMITLRLGESSTGGRTLIGECAYWFSMPLGLFVGWARKRDIVEPDNIPVILTLLSLYWACLGAAIAMAGYYLRRLILNRRRARRASAQP